MAKKITSLILSALLAVTSFSGCSTETEPVAETTLPSAPETVSLCESMEINGKTLTMDVQVEVPDLNSLEEATLVFDEDLLDKMVEELVHSQYPDLKEGTMDGDRDWSVATPEQLLFSFSCDDDGFEAGRTGYLDVGRNLNGHDMFDDSLNRWTPYYLTPHIPEALEMTSVQAEKVLSDFLSRYSCFDYEAWNMVACDAGYYQAQMRPLFDGRPVILDQVPFVGACLSAEGIFEFQGIMVLKELSRKPIEVTYSLDEAVEQFKEDFADDPKGDRTTLNRIYVGYISESYYDETRSLSPAWVFEYSSVKPHLNTGEEQTQYYTAAYRMKDGNPYYYNY